MEARVEVRDKLMSRHLDDIFDKMRAPLQDPASLLSYKFVKSTEANLLLNENASKHVLQLAFTQYRVQPADFVFVPIFDEDIRSWSLVVYVSGDGFYLFDSNKDQKEEKILLACRQLSTAFELKSAAVYRKPSPVHTNASESGVFVIETVKYVIDHCLAKKKSLNLVIPRPTVLSCDVVQRKWSEAKKVFEYPAL
jgi:hypothetical protein